MKILRKYLLRILVLLLGASSIYKEKILGKPLFPQTTNEKDLYQLFQLAKTQIPYYKKYLPNPSTEDSNFIRTFDKIDFILEKNVLKNDLSQILNPNKFNNKNVLDYHNHLFRTIFKIFSYNIFIPMNTSGSSGSPLYFYKSKEDTFRFVIQFLEIARYHGWKENEPYMICLQEGVYSQLTVLKPLFLFTGMPLFLFKKIDKKSAESFVRMLNRNKPSILFSFPSYISEMAAQIKKHNIPINISLKAIHCTGEMLFDHQRKILEEVYQTKVYNIYATNELSLIGTECEIQDGIHIFESHIFLESSKEQKILGTVLDQDYMPLIKYDTGDRGIIKYEKCSCGIKGKKITNLEGRIEEYLLDHKEGKVYASYLRQLLLRANEEYNNSILRAQFIQKKNKDIKFIIQLITKEYSDEVIKYLTVNLKDDYNFNANGTIVETLFQEKGKFKFLIKE